MKLSEELLRKLGEQRPTSPGRHTLTHMDAASGWTVVLDTEQVDALSGRYWDVSLQPTSGRARLDASGLRQKAEAIAERVCGLMEPLKLIECDVTRIEAILRSDEPTVRGEKRSHFELRLDGNRHVTMRRFEAACEPAAKREQTPFTLTHEVVGHFMEDLAKILD